MDTLVNLIEVLVTLGVFVLVVIVMAALFIVVLSIATGIDRNIQPEDERRT